MTMISRSIASLVLLLLRARLCCQAFAPLVLSATRKMSPLSLRFSAQDLPVAKDLPSSIPNEEHQHPPPHHPHHHPLVVASPDGTLFVPHEVDEPLSSEVISSLASSDELDVVEDVDASIASPTKDSLWERLLSTYLGPRAVLIVISAFYATNFPLGSIMNDNLPASASTCARMVLAGLALAPTIRHLNPELRIPAMMCGCFTAMGYVTQSLALIDTDAARVSFLGSATVLWCPFLQAVIDKQPMGLKDAPQTWLAAVLCIAGVGVLELAGSTGLSFSVSLGDVLALLQAVGFGTGVFWTSRMLSKHPDQALPVTATLIATTSFLSMIWALVDGWMFTTPDWQTALAVPGLFFHPSIVAAAVLWTGVVSTSLTFWVELMALGRVDPSEASVLLASEPLFAALFAAAFLGHSLGVNDAVGGALMVSACLANAVLTPSSFAFLWGGNNSNDDNENKGDRVTETN